MPAEEFYRYDKYIPPQHRFCYSILSDEGVENLMFKGCALVPNHGIKVAQFPEPVDYYRRGWAIFSNVGIDCPPDDFQHAMARRWMLEKVHYQHWTANAKETYEQLVGDEVYEGINA